MIVGTESQKWINHNGCVNVLVDIDKTEIEKIGLEENLHTIQLYEFTSPKKETWETLNAFLKDRPSIGLRIKWEDIQDLKFYQFLPDVRNVSISFYDTKDFTLLASNKRLLKFGIEETKSKAVDISFIKDFRNLQALYVDGMKKGLESISFLKNLQELTLRGVKLDSLDFLKSTPELRKLRLLYGSYEDLNALGKLENLKHLEISRVRKIENFIFINELSKLESLIIEGQTGLEELPKFENKENLEYLSISNNRNLRDISNIDKFKNLKVFWISFSENQKSREIKHLLKQSIDFVLKTESIEYTNLSRFHWVSEEDKELLSKNGKKKYSEWIVNNKHKL